MNAAGSPPIKNLVWIASYPKSGNTWTRFIVDRLTRPETAFDINESVRHSLGFVQITAKAIRDQGVRLTDNNFADVRRYWGEVQRAISGSGTDRIFLKTHNIAARFDTGPFPDPAVTHAAIYLVRDPRDVAISYAHHYKTDVTTAVQMMCQPFATLCQSSEVERTELLKSWGQHVTGWTAEKPFPTLVLRYEDLLADTPAAVLQMARFLDVPCEASRAAEIADETGFDKLKAQEDAGGFADAVTADGFFRAGRSGQWRGFENPSVFEPLSREFAEVMRKFGYAA
ncbi:MAG: sulfotransferase domain-containing protein [Rhodospirillales bacterium]